MKRLLVVTTIPDTISCFLLPFIQHFRAQGWQVDGMAQGISQFAPCQDVFDRVWDVQWSRNPLAIQHFHLTPQRIRTIVEREQYDLVHVHTPVAAFVTRWALRSLRKRRPLKIIYTAHGLHYYRGGPWLKNLIFLGLEKLAAPWTDHLVVINREDDATAKQHLLPAKQVHYMPGIGVDLSTCDPQRIRPEAIQQICIDLGLSEQRPHFLCLAEFIPRKRHADLLRAFAHLNRSNVDLVLAGDGPIMSEMQQLARQLGIASQVHFVGWQDNVPALIRSSLSTLLISEREGLPRSVMEALCLETPVIGSAIRGTHDLLQGNCGIAVPVGDIGAIAEAMAWMLDHPEAARAMGQQGRKYMQNFAIESILALHESLYETALQDHTTHPGQHHLNPMLLK